MIERDRDLLSRMATVNTHLGQVVMQMLARAQGGVLDSADLRAVGHALGELGADMQCRARELDAPVVDGKPQIEASR